MNPHLRNLLDTYEETLPLDKHHLWQDAYVEERRRFNVADALARSARTVGDTICFARDSGDIHSINGKLTEEGRMHARMRG